MIELELNNEFFESLNFYSLKYCREFNEIIFACQAEECGEVFIVDYAMCLN